MDQRLLRQTLRWYLAVDGDIDASDRLRVALFFYDPNLSDFECDHSKGEGRWPDFFGGLLPR
jgi:hypothetical protein